jgi:uncharacterized protein (TIGR03083 family)
MRIPVVDSLARIEEHTRGLADAARGHLDARVEHCPDWSVGDLVHHLTEVHTFWEYVARERPSTPPEDLPDLVRADDDTLVDAMLAAMRRLLDTLAACDQAAPCWTWGLDENVGFITRHQIQEAAVHHWDAVNATGAGAWSMDEAAAVDAVQEFLSESVANRRWPMPDAPPLAGTLWFRTETRFWAVFDGDLPGTLGHTVAADASEPVVTGPAAGGDVRPADLLLWFYRRLPDPTIGGVTGERALLDRFRAFTSTD